MTEHEIEIRVRYCETDAMGFLHHANYLSYFEMGRTEMFRAAGGNYRKMEQAGLFLVVVKVTCNYRRPARYDDLLTLRTRLKNAGPAKLDHEYLLMCDGTVLAEAEVRLACVDRDGSIRRIPEEIRATCE